MSVTKIMTIEEMANHKKWLETRRTGIGGSDAAVVVGLNKYRSLFSLWMDKTGQSELEEERTPEAEEKMMWGRRFEDDIADEFSKRTGKKLQRCGMLRSNEYPFMLADVDRLVVGENAIVEIKTTASWNKDEWEGDNVPDSYFCQIQHYLSVGGWDKCYLVCLIGGQKMVVKEVERSDDDIEALVEAEKEFWEEYVVPKKIPSVDATETCRGCLQKLYKGGEKEEFLLDGKFDADLDNRMALKEQIKQLEAMVQEIENKICLEMENHEKGQTLKYKISYPSRTRTNFKSKEFKADYKALFEQYSTTSTYRPLTIKAIKREDEE